jgi:hypothetical protein
VERHLPRPHNAAFISSPRFWENQEETLLDKNMKMKIDDLIKSQAPNSRRANPEE